MDMLCSVHAGLNTLYGCALSSAASGTSTLHPARFLWISSARTRTACTAYPTSASPPTPSTRPAVPARTAVLCNHAPTNHMHVCACVQVYALDKRYLDPRRPMTAKATPEQAEEGLIPYSELIIFNTLGFPTQDKQVGVGRV